MRIARSLFQPCVKISRPLLYTAAAPSFVKSRSIWSTSNSFPIPTATKTTTTFRAISTAQQPTMASATSFYDFTTHDKKGRDVPLADYKGKVVLVVNTASKCGFTPQFGGLETLYKDLTSKYPEDFVIIGFPCNQFGGQDPGSNDEIQEFCQVNYGVSFPIMGKVDVNGDKAEPVWDWMKNEKPGLMGLKRIKWNFEKFLINREGKVIGRWASTSKPESLEKTIIEEIEKTKKQ